MCVQDAVGLCLSVSSRARALRIASLWFSFDVMPGMVVLISACRVSSGQMSDFNCSQRCASVERMSACSFCCSLNRWFKLFLFQSVFCGTFSDENTLLNQCCLPMYACIFIYLFFSICTCKELFFTSMQLS